jgi:hypothetical protein
MSPSNTIEVRPTACVSPVPRSAAERRRVQALVRRDCTLNSCLDRPSALRPQVWQAMWRQPSLAFSQLAAMGRWAFKQSALSIPGVARRLAAA